MKISKYTKLGLLVIACLTILVWGINYLKGIDILRSNATYYVIYERIDGLLESSPVNINGYQVGQVTDIAFLEDYSGRLMATLSLRADFKIAKGSTAKIVSSDIMGTKSIKIEIVHSNEYYNTNDTIPGDVESDLKEQVSMQVLPLKKKAEELIASLDSALTVITYVFNKRTRDNLTESFENINLTIANIEKVSAELNRIMGSGKINSIVENLDSISGSITRNSGNVTNVIKNLSALTDSISKLDISPVFDDLKSSVAGINSVLQKLNADDNTAGLLMNDTQLYQNLNNLTGSMDLLLKDVKNNPKRYVHFSALDVSKDVYITAKSNPQEGKNTVTYKIQLLSSTSRLSMESDIFKGLGEIEVEESKDLYTYLVGNTSDFNEITTLFETARVNFPEANVVAYKNGKRTKFVKAIRNQ
ncbi:MAG TPA: MlaD family protein [Prolixibacteraceae bacterium]|nr:MlaD family protein [Prolixibacteraceae bacterium]